MRVKKHPDSFHGSIQPILCLAQICGLIPVKGIFGPRIRFSWRNMAHAYAFLISLVTLFFDCCYTVDNFRTAIRIDVFASTVFYTVCLLTTGFFLQVAKEMPSISEDFLQVERAMKELGYPKRLGLKLKAFLAVFTVLAIVEHGTLACINFNSAWKSSVQGKESFGRAFYDFHFPAISWRLPYSGLGTILLFWVNCMCTFNWNYLDFFLIVMSTEISSRFAQINSKLSATNIQKADPAFWEKVSRDYNRLSVLTKKLDKKLSKIILTSFFSNLYHLSLQLVRSLKVNGSLFQKTYFYFSLAYLVVRLLLVLFTAARVNVESRRPVAKLFSLDSPCEAAVRFFHQALTDEIALTGSRFFLINNRFFVSVVGTIATYQGVLLQYNSLNYNPGASN